MRYGDYVYYTITHRRTKQYLSRDREYINTVLYIEELNYKQVSEQWSWLKRKIEINPFSNYKLADFAIEKHQIVITEISLPL